MSAGAAWPCLRDLEEGDLVPADLYVLDYRDGTRPRWMVHRVEELESGGRLLELEDPGNVDLDLMRGETRVAVTVLAWPSKTLRSQLHVLGGPIGNTLCDMDQQGRYVAKVAS